MREGNYVSVDGVRTHYLEAGIEHRGRKPSVVLLASAEYGGAAEMTWEFNIGPLGQHYHVLAPDHLGFGLTDKIHDFGNQFNRSWLPDGPKVGTISLSPRGDWRMPSDAQAGEWLRWANG